MAGRGVRLFVVFVGVFPISVYSLMACCDGGKDFLS